LAHAQVWTQDSAFHPALTNDSSATAQTRFAPTADRRVLAYGNFTHLHNGDVPAPGIAYLHADESVDPSFAAHIDTGHFVVAAAPLRNGRVLVV